MAILTRDIVTHCRSNRGKGFGPKAPWLRGSASQLIEREALPRKTGRTGKTMRSQAGAWEQDEGSSGRGRAIVCPAALVLCCSRLGSSAGVQPLGCGTG